MVLKVCRWSSPAQHSCTIFDVWNCVCFSNLQNIGWNFMWAKIVLEYLYKWASVQFFRSKDQVGSQAGVRGVADQSFIINPNNSNEHGNESWSSMRNAWEMHMRNHHARIIDLFCWYQDTHREPLLWHTSTRIPYIYILTIPYTTSSIRILNLIRDTRVAIFEKL